MSTTENQEDTTKKGPLDSLDRDELVKKCKHLLVIAKNAKQAKDECQTENLKLKESIKKYESQISSDKQSLSAMQEVVDSLTEKDLMARTEIEKLQCSLNATNEQLQTMIDQSIENESMKRQIKRLTDENDELMKDLQNSENQLQKVKEASIQQNKDLILLEETTTKWAKLEMVYQDLSTKYNDLMMENQMLKNATSKNVQQDSVDVAALTKQLNAVQRELEVKQESILNYEYLSEQANRTSEELEKMKVELCEKIRQCTELETKLGNEETTDQNDTRKNVLFGKQLKNQSKKLNLYKSKILEFSAQLKQLRLSKDILSKTVNEYSMDVSKWQIEIVTVSNKLFEKIQHLQSEKNNSLERIKLLEEENKAIRQDSNKMELKIAEINIELMDKIKTVELYKDFEFKYNELVIDHEKLMKEIEEQNGLIQKSQCDTETEHLNLKNENENLNEKLMEFVKQRDELQTLIAELKDEIVDKENRAIQFEIDLKCARKQLEGNEQRLHEITEEHKTHINGQQKLQDDLITMENDLMDKNKMISNLEQQVCDFQQEVANLKSNSHQMLQERDQILQRQVEETEAILRKKAQETDELLSEMREINEALKNRGDVISKQNSKMTEMEIESEKCRRKLTELESLCNAKSAEIVRMTAMISDYEKASVTNDTFSTSSMSKTEEIARMRDIEDSFEEKYNKLRGLAVKLKKKVTEQTAIIAKLESKQSQNSDEGIQINSKLGAIEIQVKNLQLLQSENDSLQDRIDMLTDEKRNGEKQIDELKGEIVKLTNELADLKNINLDSKNVVQESNKSKMTLEQAIKEYVKQIQVLKNDCNSCNIVIKDMEQELHKLKDEISLKDKEILALKEGGNKTKIELNKMKSSMKSKNVLNLEMEAYEKSLKEVSQKLEDKISQITELQLTVKSSENSNEALKHQIKILEDSLESEKQHSIELKHQIDIQQSKLKECEHDKLNLNSSIDELTKENGSIKIELENVRLSAEQNAIDREKIVQVLQAENEKNVRQICTISDESTNLKTKLREAEQELVDLKTAYASYKVRAQLVLRQNQSSETSRENELEDELASLRTYLENTQTKLNTISEQKDQLFTDFEEMKVDKERLQSKCKELLELLDESRSQIETMHLDIQKQCGNHQEVLKAQRLQIDTLNNCYKKQILELEEKHKKDMEEMKCKIQLEKSEYVKTTANLNADASLNLAQFRPLSTDEQKIEWILTERQEGEGSENTTTSGYSAHRKISTPRNRRDIIPLDELLDNSFEDNVTFTDVSVSPSVELQATKEKLNLQESRVKHLSALLAEAEQDLAKLTQLNDVLKEEMRRNERSTEREKHLHNLEYLKNVVFKFLTINNGDEKLHLVPVLNTILKLSPEETQKLQICAKGDSNSRSWGTYLPIWNSNS